MRVLFTTWAWPTHYFPMVPLAWALRAAGHEVLMASQPDLLPSMRASGLPCTSVGHDVDVAAVHREGRELIKGRRLAQPPPDGAGRMSDHLTGYLHNPDLVPIHRTLRRIEDRDALTHHAAFQARWSRRPTARPSRLTIHGLVALAMADGLLALARSWRPDVIVYDPLTYAGPLVARLIGIPAVRHLFGPDVTYFMKDDDIRTLLDRFGVDDLDLLGTTTIDPCPPSLQYPDAIAPTTRIHTRYIPYNGLPQVPTTLPGRPRRERICLTWGTSTDRLLGQQAFLPENILRGCTRLVEERDAELIVAITASQRNLLPDPAPPRFHILESIPLNAVLPTCDALIHQGGAGTMFTALHHALPQVILTQLLDQTANAFQLTAAGAARTHPAQEVTSTDLVDTANRLLDDATHRSAAFRLQQEMHHLPTPADAVSVLAGIV